MAVTKVFKKGACLMLVEGSTYLAELEYPGLNVEGSNIRMEDFIRDESFFIPIADVRDSAGAAIGTQTEAEVRDYIAEQMAL